jgi:hypothetical protein
MLDLSKTRMCPWPPRFSTCDICYDLKNRIGSRVTPAEQRLASLKPYREHLASQFTDRQIVWMQRECAMDMTGPGSRTLTILTDGMDQGKLCIPRDPQLRLVARLAGAQRPRCKVHGAWALGWVLGASVLDETSRHDSTCIIEVIQRALERARPLEDPSVSQSVSQIQASTCFQLHPAPVRSPTNAKCRVFIVTLSS